MHALLVAALVLGASVWIGGFVTIIVLSRSARMTLQPTQRVDLMRHFGRSYLPVAFIAMVLIVVAGGGLLAQRPWDTLATVLVLIVAATVIATAIGVIQARAMTRLRRRLLAAPDSRDLSQQVNRGARRARVLRSAIGVLSVAMFAMALACATT